MSKPWKEAASVIVLGRSVFFNSHLKGNNGKPAVTSSLDYKILVVKRAAKSSFMPNGYVFPGGVYHEADASTDWLDLYRTMNVGSTNNMYPFTPETDAKKVRTNNNLSFEGNGQLPKPVSLRITAIRELFEESGLLLVKNSRTHGKNDWFNSKWASYFYSHDIMEWQFKIQKNPFEFINLCRHFKCVPDVWSLKDWSIWLTPVHVPSKRFDTAFFVAALNNIPPTEPDNKEVSDLKWSTSGELLEKHRLQEIWLPPPQFYELSRIETNFENIKYFIEYSSSWCGCDRWMPVGIRANDGWVYLLPGDEMYPLAPDFLGRRVNGGKEERVSDQNMKDLRANCLRLHRFEIYGPHNADIIITHLPSSDHVYPNVNKKMSAL